MSAINVPGKKEEDKPRLIQEDVPYESPVVRTDITPYSPLSTFHSGSRMTGDYYQAVNARDSVPKAMQEGLPAVYGQYKKVKGLEVRVNTTISHKQTQDATRGFNSTLQVTFPGVIIPQEGDVFIFDMGQGQPVIAAITSPTELGSPYTEGAGVAELRVIKKLTKEIQDIYDSKVVDTLYWSQKLLRQGLKPLLSSEEVGLHRSLTRTFRRLTMTYLRDYFYPRYGTLMVPMQAGPTYDPFVTKFVKAVFDSSLSPIMQQIKVLNVESSIHSTDLTIFDALLSLDEAMIDVVAQKSGVIGVGHFQSIPGFRSIYFTGIRQCVVMTDSPYSNSGHGQAEITTSKIERAGARKSEGRFILPVLTPGVREDMPANTNFVHWMDKDDYYILSEQFYLDQEGQSMLDILVRQAISREAIDLKMLDRIASYADQFDVLERFYYIPLIIALIRMELGVVG